MNASDYIGATLYARKDIKVYTVANEYGNVLKTVKKGQMVGKIRGYRNYASLWWIVGDSPDPYFWNYVKHEKGAFSMSREDAKKAQENNKKAEESQKAPDDRDLGTRIEDAFNRIGTSIETVTKGLIWVGGGIAVSKLFDIALNRNKN